jgi:hypothetical protein
LKGGSKAGWTGSDDNDIKIFRHSIYLFFYMTGSDIPVMNSNYFNKL